MKNLLTRGCHIRFFFLFFFSKKGPCNDYDGQLSVGSLRQQVIPFAGAPQGLFNGRQAVIYYCIADSVRIEKANRKW